MPRTEDSIPEGFVAVGRVSRPHGVGGDVFVEPWTDEPDARFAEGSKLTTQPGSAGPLTVSTYRVSSGNLVVHFAGVDDRDAAQSLRGTLLLVEASSRPALADPDEFYDSDLIGLTAQLGDGSRLGAVHDVVHGPAGDLLVIDIEGRECLVPFVSAIVPRVDLDAGVVEVDPPSGLFDV